MSGDGGARRVKRRLHRCEGRGIDVDARRAARVEIEAGAGIEHFGGLGRTAVHGGSDSEAGERVEETGGEVKPRESNRQGF